MIKGRFGGAFSQVPLSAFVDTTGLRAIRTTLLLAWRFASDIIARPYTFIVVSIEACRINSRCIAIGAPVESSHERTMVLAAQCLGLRISEVMIRSGKVD